MPLYENAVSLIRQNLIAIQGGAKPPMQVIGKFTDEQFSEINRIRVEKNKDELKNNEIVFIGKHLYNSRSNDGYTINDMILQIISALDESSKACHHGKMSGIQNQTPRDDGLQNQVKDMAVFEMTTKKPRAELFSVIPKGDQNKPTPKSKSSP